MRREFSNKTKAFARDAATDNDGTIWCAMCELPINGRPEYDHIIPDAFDCDLLGFEINDPRNCQVLCVKCHKIKTHTQDRPAINKADRLRKKHTGIIRPKGTIKSRGFR